MKFYVINDGLNLGPVIGCETSLERAKQYGREHSADGTFEVYLVGIDEPREALRRLLGDLGGYASELPDDPVYVCQRVRKL